MELGSKLHFTFGGTLKQSVRLHSFDPQTSKHINRLNIYFEAHIFQAKDIVKIDNKLIKVSKLGKIIYGTNIKNNKSLTIDLKNKKYEVLKIHMTSVSKLHPNVEVLHPETYQSVKVENKANVKLGEKVNVVIDDGKVFII